MIWSVVWWIHEVLIRSVFMWGQCFVAGSTGCAELGVVQGHVNELLLQEPRQVLCTTWRKAQNGPHVERLELEFQFLLPVSEKCVKYGEPKHSRSFLVQKPKPAWEKHSDVGWPLLIPSGFGQFENGDVFTSQTDPSEGSKHGLCCVRGGSITPCSTQLKTPGFFGRGTRWDPFSGKINHRSCRAGEFLCPHPPAEKTLPSVSMLPFLPLRQDFLLQPNSKCFINSSSVCKWTLKIDYFLFVSFSLQMFLPLWGRQLFC